MTGMHLLQCFIIIVRLYKRQANNAVKKGTEFRFFQWLLSQLGVSEGQSGLDVVKGAKVEAIHKCLSILQEFTVVEVNIIPIWTVLCIITILTAFP